jgi:hypothetical protein
MSADEYEAVMVNDGNKITREMMYAEFEAILDSFVPLPEYAGENIKAIYLRISPQLKVNSAVFFHLAFDQDGNADPKWNIPLEQLAEQGEPGPNLGGGPIRLACKSQCPVEWHTNNLWDPEMGRDPNDFVLLRDVVARNKLDFKVVPLEVEGDEELVPPVVGEEVAPQAAPVMAVPTGEISASDTALAANLIQLLRKKLDEEQSDRFVEMAKQQELLLAAQKTKFEEELNTIEQGHSEELKQSMEKMQEFHSNLEESQKKIERLEQELAGSGGSAESASEDVEQKLANKEIEDKLAAKEMELAYKDDEIDSIKEEVKKLHDEKAVLISQGGDEFLNRLKDNEVSFVVYHAGAGHINIDLDDIGSYLENPLGYAAKSCEVEEQLYKEWLTHQDVLACNFHVESKGEPCGKKLKSVPQPSQFVTGKSDRCPLHWSFGEDK